MSALFDSDDSANDAEEIARQYVESEQRRFAIRAQSERAIREVRTALTTVALARALGTEDGTTLDRLHDDLVDGGVEMLADAVMVAVWDGGRPIEHIAADLAKAMQAPDPRRAVDEPTVELPLTCPAPEAHAREVRRSKPLWWLRDSGLLGGDRPDDAPCPLCGNPLPRSHRRNR